MNATFQQQQVFRLGFISSATGQRYLHSLDLSYSPSANEGYYETVWCEFVHSWQEEFARVLDEYEIAWQYKPRTFAVEWDEDGNFVDSFTPDFYLPALDVYVELIANGHQGFGAKARKVRLLRQQHPEIRIELLSGGSGYSIAQAFLLRH